MGKIFNKKTDLPVTIVDKETAFWTEIRTKTEQEIATLEKMLKFNRAILDMCNKYINK